MLVVLRLTITMMMFIVMIIMVVMVFILMVVMVMSMGKGRNYMRVMIVPKISSKTVMIAQAYQLFREIFSIFIICIFTKEVSVSLVKYRFVKFARKFHV